MFKIVFPILFLIILCGFLASNFQPIFITHPDEEKGISPRQAADYIQAVIEADRAVYSKYIVDRLGKTISLKATENWEHDDTLILPAQFLLFSSQISHQPQGGGMRYRLLSQWPINKNNSPRSELEKVVRESQLVTKIRGKGLLNAMVIHPTEDGKTAWEFCISLKEKGILAKPTHGHIIRFAPPLVITEEELYLALDKITEVINEFESVAVS